MYHQYENGKETPNTQKSLRKSHMCLLGAVEKKLGLLPQNQIKKKKRRSLQPLWRKEKKSNLDLRSWGYKRIEPHPSTESYSSIPENEKVKFGGFGPKFLSLSCNVVIIHMLS